MTDTIEQPTTEAPVEVKSNKVAIRPVKPVVPVGIEPQRVEAVTPAVTMESHIQSLLSSGTSAEKNAITTLQGYVDIMEPPKAVGAPLGAQKQRQLYFLLKTLLEETPTVEFNSAWRIVVYFFKTYKSFSWENAYRFIPPDAGINQINPQQAETFRQLVNLIILSGDENMVKNIRQHVDFNKTCKGFKGEALVKLASYYK